ncbi:AAA-type ATPase [Tenacibaculum phage PTm1]|uniref:AAA-type ATPase n=2 Tax=Shirahamavirus PTm1 TaxID=2846435 RepID=A0A5S9HY08_9CAUD|nr:AAA-type ATPase [Tenacibaculum phage PTm1]BBI90452.1 AAA-type ATPase [Tenacibaculum phage PTm1]BBI90760.1 AAA-type ATPase [Tenacibaculum phage PTm5]
MQEILNQIPTYSELIQFVSTQMKTNQFFQTAGFFGMLTVIATKGKTVLKYIWQRIERKLLFVATIEESEPIYEYLNKLIYDKHNNNYRKILVRTKYRNQFMRKTEKNQPDLGSKGSEKMAGYNREETLVYEQDSDMFFIRYGLQLLKVAHGREKLESAQDIDNIFMNRFVLSGFFVKGIITKLLDEALELKKKHRESENNDLIRVYTNSCDYIWVKQPNIKPKTLDKIVSNKKDSILEDMKKFIDSEQWYVDRGIFYKRGYMFYGKAGTGKTALALAIALELKRPIYCLNPAGLNDNDLKRLYRRMDKDAILLFEDVDAVFNKDRDKQDKKIKFNFSTLLNCIDGTFYKHGLITIFTTNHIERLDDALKRKGRMDVKEEINPPSTENILEYLDIFYGKQTYQPIVKERGLVMADIQEMCIANRDSISDAIRAINGDTYMKIEECHTQQSD